MSKELKAIETRQALHMIERSVGEHGWFGWEEVETLETAINELEALEKRNQPVKLLKEEGEEEYQYDEWWTPVGKCPLCNKYNPCSAKYCGECGQALERIEKGEYHE